MKKQSRRARAASLPIAPVRHQFDHEVPTVIHDPEEKLNTLARFTRHFAQNPGRYSFWILAVVLLVGLVIVLNSWNVLRPTASKEWTKLMTAKTADDRLAIAKESPNSPAAVWALVQAASDYYTDGMRDLPDNRDVAEQRLKKARELYDQIARDAPKDSFEARLAALGKARTLEARNDLAKAIEQYEHVATTWPGTPEAEQAKQLADALRKPEAVAFYKELYSYTPTKFSLPKLGNEPGMPPLSDLAKPGSTTGLGTTLDLPPLGSLPLDISPLEKAPKAAMGGATLPANVFADPVTKAPSTAPVTVPPSTPTPAPAPKRSQ
jgi:tetratricopeptide (TPR) repeat protein